MGNDPTIDNLMSAASLAREYLAGHSMEYWNAASNTWSKVTEVNLRNFQGLAHGVIGRKRGPDKIILYHGHPTLLAADGTMVTMAVVTNRPEVRSNADCKSALVDFIREHTE